MSRSLIALDTDKIKSYVFATDVLREIRGASDLLTELNKQMPDHVGGQTIYAHGGSGLFLVDTADAADAIQRVQREFAKKTRGAASITGVSVPVPDDFDPATSDVCGLWRHLGAKLDAAKARNPPSHTTVSHPLLRPGDSDGEYYATDVGHDEPGALLSCPTLAKRERNRIIRRNVEKPESLTDLSEANDGGLLALIYADGDSIGNALESCKTLCEIATTAKDIYASLTEAVKAATKDIGLCPKQYDVLLQGGDDVVIVLPERYALEAALRITERFPLATRAKLGQELTLSTGVVWAPASFPFGVWLNLTESVLTFAKTEGAKQGQSGLLNFLVVSSSSQLAFSDYYQRELVTERLEGDRFRLQRTLRPYRTDVLRDLCAYHEKLQQVSRSQLEALRRAIFAPMPYQASLDAMRTLVHWRDATTRSALQCLALTIPAGNGIRIFPFLCSDEPSPQAGDGARTLPVYTTALADLIELWDFICFEAEKATDES